MGGELQRRKLDGVITKEFGSCQLLQKTDYAFNGGIRLDDVHFSMYDVTATIAEDVDKSELRFDGSAALQVRQLVRATRQSPPFVVYSVQLNYVVALLLQAKVRAGAGMVIEASTSLSYAGQLAIVKNAPIFATPFAIGDVGLTFGLVGDLFAT